MTRLTALAAELESIRRVTTCVAVTAERMRVARDVHDLLGLGLSAIALKCAGSLTACHRGGQFTLVAEIPLQAA